MLAGTVRRLTYFWNVIANVVYHRWSHHKQRKHPGAIVVSVANLHLRSGAVFDVELGSHTGNEDQTYHGSVIH